MTDVSLNDFGVHHQSLCDVLQRAEDDVRSQEGLGQGDPPTHEREREREGEVCREVTGAD